MIDIIYEDNHIIVAYKPKEVLSQADGSSKKDMLTILKSYIKEKYGKPGDVYLGLVHRLDYNTSGVMVFARTSKAARRLSEDIALHHFEKKYYALVEGMLEVNGVFELRHFLSKNEKLKKSYVHLSGQEAVLEYKVLQSFILEGINVSKVDIRLKTGRFHQIRCQFSEIGHPLVGDKKYGSKHSLPPGGFPLEAYHLGFYHPTTRQWITFEKNKE